MKTTSRFRATLSLITIGLLACTGLAVADSDSYAENFESYGLGYAITNAAGWVAADGESVIVATNYSADYVGGTYPIAYDHSVTTKVLQIASTVSNTVAAGASSQTNWVDVVIKPVISEDTPALPAAGSVAGCYFNASSNLVVLYAPTWDTVAWVEIAEVSVDPNEWIRVTIAANMADGNDFDDWARFYQIYINGTVVTNAAAYVTPSTLSGTGGSWFSSGASIVRTAPITNVVVQGTGYLDDLVMTNALAFSAPPPAEPSYIEVLPSVSVLTQGATLGDAVLTGGSATNGAGASVSGSFAFASPATVPPVGTNSYDVVFTPTDAVTYLSATGQVDVVVAALALTSIGTPISWYELFSIDPGTNTYDQLDLLDSDSDGVPNWQEYVGGTQPTNSASSLRLLVVSASSTNVVVRWIGGTNGPAVPYVILGAPSLVGSPIAWSNVSSQARQEGTNTWSSGGAPGTMQFFQIRATSE